LDFIQDVRDLIKNISNQMGLQDSYKGLMEEIPAENSAERTKQVTIVQNFGTNMDQKLTAYMEQEGIKKVAALLANNHLRGIGNKITEKNAAEQMMEEAKATAAAAATASAKTAKGAATGNG
jgi:hypothetical protein